MRCRPGGRRGSGFGGYTGWSIAGEGEGGYIHTHGTPWAGLNPTPGLSYCASRVWTGWVIIAHNNRSVRKGGRFGGSKFLTIETARERKNGGFCAQEFPPGDGLPATLHSGFHSGAFAPFPSHNPPTSRPIPLPSLPLSLSYGLATRLLTAPQKVCSLRQTW